MKVIDIESARKIVAAQIPGMRGEVAQLREKRAQVQADLRAAEERLRSLERLASMPEDAFVEAAMRAFGHSGFEVVRSRTAVLGGQE